MAAIFEVCPGCGQHGSIFLDNGMEIGMISDQEIGLKIIEALIISEFVTQEEVVELRRQIKASGLLEKMAEVQVPDGSPMEFTVITVEIARPSTPGDQPDEMTENLPPGAPLIPKSKKLMN